MEYELWVCKPDGTIQCAPQEEGLIPLATAREELAALIGEENILEGARRPPFGAVIARCGAPTGNVNAFKVTVNGFKLLMTGIAGTGGFVPVPLDQLAFAASMSKRIASEERGDDPIVPWPTVNFSGGPDWVPWPWVLFSAGMGDNDDGKRAFMAAVASFTAVGAQPTLIAELIGRPCRTYVEGHMITMDYLPGRLNVVTDEQGRVTRIWFG